MSKKVTTLFRLMVLLTLVLRRSNPGAHSAPGDCRADPGTHCRTHGDYTTHNGARRSVPAGGQGCHHDYPAQRCNVER